MSERQQNKRVFVASATMNDLLETGHEIGWDNNDPLPGRPRDGHEKEGVRKGESKPD